ncbi:MAG TPA: DinB family protein [Acidimicrobiales bacterium]|nr:DinB family protein [Acidimicrobiales bacterium]
MSWLERLDAVATRLHDLAARDLHGLTAPDAPTGERWDAGQVWAHLAEFGDYWLGELDKVLAGAETFGRTKADPERIAAIERDRHTPLPELIARVDVSIGRLRTRLSSMSEDDWRRTSRHPTLGDMSIDDQLQHFHVGHYEEHADQLESLT